MRILPVKNLLNYNYENVKTSRRNTKNQNSLSSNDTFSFKGINTQGIVKQRGLMFHISSLPATRSFCGQFGDVQTKNFIDWLAKAKQTHWILNPLNALNQDLCPYSSFGRFSRNKFLVNLNLLTGKEYDKILKPKELPDDITAPSFTLEMLEKQKNPRFSLAFSRFQKLPESSNLKKEYTLFVEKNDTLWLEDYACFDTLGKEFKNTNWTQWSKEFQTAPEDAKAEGISLKEKLLSLLNAEENKKKVFSDNIDLYKFEQFLYDKQFNEMVDYLDSKNIRLILDLPIGVDSCGVDTWSKKGMFLLDENFKPTKISGCPPEKNYPYTQSWGHALYNYDSPEFWDYQEASLKQLISHADLRLDHFVGYINRAEIPTSYTKPDGTVLNGTEIFKPIEEGGMGIDFFENSWVQDIYNKRNKKGENIFEVFMRVAKEAGKKPEDVYILENFGPLAKTPAYKAFDKKYGKNFISQKVPIGLGLKDFKNTKNDLNSPFDIKKNNIALLTGNHDLPSLKECLDELIKNTKGKSAKVNKKAGQLFERFCKEELKLTPEEMNNPDAIFENTIKWFYTRNVKQVQTTLQDALGLYFRPNIPGFWNGMPDKYLMKPTAEALLPFWSRIFPKDFLSRENNYGVNPGYKSLADKFINTMEKLYPKINKSIKE